jgi:hypothetical protein
VRVAAFAGLSAVLFVGLALGLTLVFSTNAGRHAVAVSAAVAWGVQFAAFALLWRLRRRHVLAGWSMGVGMRFLALAVFALLAVPSWGLMPNAALCSLAVFFFVSILFEPWLLRS